MIYRPKFCEICFAPLEQQPKGRARKTCSDRCRQIKRRRYDYHRWIDPRAADQRSRAAERQLRRIEREVGPIDDSVPKRRDISSPTLSVRQRLQIRLAMGQEVPTCIQCFKPYIREEGTSQFCSAACRRAYLKQREAVRKAIEAHRGQYDPRVDVRVRLGSVVKLCEHCRKPYPPYSARRKFCSDACRKQHWREEQRRAERQREGRRVRQKRRRTPHCLICGAGIPAGSRSDRVYCSRACQIEAAQAAGRAKRAAPKERVCGMCGLRFLVYGTAKGNRKYCSKRCANRSKYRAWKARQIASAGDPPAPAYGQQG